MIIKRVVWRHRNDFAFIAKCLWCGHEERRNDGYADAYFQQHVVPSLHCPVCGFNQHKEKSQQEA